MSSRVARELLDWYRAEARDLPWRKSRDPYAIWVSEVMLQQTRVDTARRYFGVFLERFPTLESLASASEEQVRVTWSGLGYYRRARFLHAAARELIEASREIPRQASELAQLPGIGAYTAAAIASIAFGQVVAVLDGNVERVTARLLAEPGSPKAAPVRRRLLAVAESLLDHAAPGDSNQALMELGATLCLPRAPRCGDCPLARGCRAARCGQAESYPRVKKRGAAHEIRAGAVVLLEAGRVFLRRRPDAAGFLAGTWEPPWVELGPREEVRAVLTREMPALRVGALVGRISHAITFRRFSVEVFEGQVADGHAVVGAVAAVAAVAESEAERFFNASELSGVPTSALARKILRAAGFQ